ncbi:hypothetical protein JCM8115_006755 [Rhodotorula mucilaginosa]
MAPRARSASCSTPPKSPIILDDGASHDEDATPTSLQDESAAAAAAAFDKLAPRRKRSLSADSHDRASAAAVVQVDPIGAAVQLPDREPRAISLAPPPPSSETPWKSVALQSPPLPIPFVAVTSPPLTVPAPPQHQHQHQHRSAYPISSAAGFVQEAPAVYQSPYSFVSYDLSPGFLPLPPPSTTTTTSTALPPVVAPFSSAPSGLPEQHPETFSPPFPVPPTTLYYPIPGEPNHLLPPSAGYSLPPASHAVETYLPSPPLSLHDAALLQAGHGRLHLAPGPGPGPIGQHSMPWPATTPAPPPRSPPRLVANGFTYPISSSSSAAPSPRAHFDPGLQVRAVPPTVLWSKGALASFGAATSTTKRFEASPTTKTSNGGGGRRPQVHEHGSPDWSVLRQQIQAGEHPRSRGTCKFFNPQTGFGYIIDDRAEELATDVFVHFTGIEQSRGFRCLSPGERVEYILTQNSAGRVQALKVVGENGAQLLGLADPVQANRVRDAARKLSPTIDSGGSDSSSSPSSLSGSGGGGARPRKPRVVPIPPSKLMAPIMAGTTNALGLIEPIVHSD